MNSFNQLKNVFSGLSGHERLYLIILGRVTRFFYCDIKGGLKVLGFKSLTLPAEKFEEHLVSALKEFVYSQDTGHIEAVLCPLPQSVLIKRLQLSEVPGESIPEAIKRELRGESSFDTGLAMVDYLVLSQTTKKDGTPVKDIISAMTPEEQLRSQVLLLQRAGLICVRVAPLAFTFSELITYYHPQEPGAVVGVVHLDEGVAFIAMYKQGSLRFFRELPATLNRMKEALSGELATDKGPVTLTGAEVESVLFEFGVPLSGEGSFAGKISFAQISVLLRPSLEHLSQEIKRTLSYYDSEFQDGDLKRILICGRGAEIPHFADFLKREFSLEIVNLELPGAISMPANIPAKEISTCYPYLGLALNCEKGVNLLPDEFRLPEPGHGQSGLPRWLGVAAGLFLLGLFLLFLRGALAYKKRLDEARLNLRALSEVAAIKNTQENFEQFYSRIKTSHPAGTLLKQIGRISPRELFLDTLNIDYQARTVTMSGIINTALANPEAILNKFVRGLETAGVLANGAISSLEKIERADLFAISFKLNFDIP